MTFGGMGFHCKCLPIVTTFYETSQVWRSRNVLHAVTLPGRRSLGHSLPLKLGLVESPLPRFHSHGSFMNWNQLNCVDRSAWSRAGGGPSPPPGAGAASAGGKRRKKKRKHWACYSRHHGNSLRPWSMDCASWMNLTPDGPISHSVLACVINGQNVTRWEVFRVITWCFMF